jgi:hypothetical protein
MCSCEYRPEVLTAAKCEKRAMLCERLALIYPDEADSYHQWAIGWRVQASLYRSEE